MSGNLKSYSVVRNVDLSHSSRRHTRMEHADGLSADSMHLGRREDRSTELSVMVFGTECDHARRFHACDGFPYDGNEEQ